jgi:hypothetical protein
MNVVAHIMERQDALRGAHELQSALILTVKFSNMYCDM